ncbi:nucleotidyl transferase AbiEii/AbiGii toxin family protein [Bernardetia sp. Wsw4-3y2]|uniref:nucleotidyl transferase AbiEii/AbiGii toxin family protein n=1 Tax=Bernardetia sp. Wsw4-3y2 TaxID=3127471 RepID=UPI0030CF6178
MSNAVEVELRRIARKSGENFDEVLTKFLRERFLYRVSISEYKNKVYLKGGTFLHAILPEKSRSTKDIDFLMEQTQNEIEEVKKVVIEILQMDCEDGVSFDISSIETSSINEQGAYQGVQIRVKPIFNKKKRNYMKLEFGFGDIITPEAKDLSYPTYIEDLGIPIIKAYTVESVIAEKFEAMISLGEASSRVKDLYDVNELLESGNYKLEDLRKAIYKTFDRRNTQLIPNPALFEEEYYNEKRKNMWLSWLRKSSLDTNKDLNKVLENIKENLEPIYKDYLSSRKPSQ